MGGRSWVQEVGGGEVELKSSLSQSGEISAKLPPSSIQKGLQKDDLKDPHKETKVETSQKRPHHDKVEKDTLEDEKEDPSDAATMPADAKKRRARKKWKVRRSYRVY